MKPALVGGAVVALIAAAAAISPALASVDAGPVDRVVVRFSQPGVPAAAVAKSVAASSQRALPYDRAVLTVARTKLAATVAKLKSDHRVASASLEQRVHATLTPNDPCYAAAVSACTVYPPPPAPAPPLQGSTNPMGTLASINAPGAWTITHTGVPVAVLDGGVDRSHPDLANKVDPVGETLCRNTDPTALCAPGEQDLLGHGTHVSGIIAAATNNGSGIAGAGWDTTVKMYKVLDDNGNGFSTDVATGIRDATNQGLRVINMSLGGSCGSGPDPDTESAVSYAVQHGVTVVAAAGNDCPGVGKEYPAAYPGVISVANADNNRIVQTTSVFGPWVSIAAPGTNVLSTFSSQGQPICAGGTPPTTPLYEACSGTSMASPHVAAAAALILNRYPSLSGPQVLSRIQSSAQPLAGGNPIGGGFLDMGAALTVTAGNVNGYAMAGADGRVYAFGAYPHEGDTNGLPLNRPVVGIAPTPGRLGYWMTASDGGIFSFGDAVFQGSTGNIRLNQPVVGLAATRSGQGYWEVATDGGVFSFGNAVFKGSTGNIRLNQPIVGMAATPDSGGYWMAASDGGVFSFGNAVFRGSTGNIRLNQPIVGMAATPDGGGYWMVASDGGVFSFGNAVFHGSTGNMPLNRPIVAMVASPTGNGYWLIASDGGVFTFGDAQFVGSAGNIPIPAPVVSATG